MVVASCYLHYFLHQNFNAMATTFTVEDSTPLQNVNSRIFDFRNAGDLSSAIKLCQEACDKFPEKKRMKSKVFRDLRKYILDIESRKGTVCAEILTVNNTSLSKGKAVLMKYSDRYSINSHDAVIAGTLLETRDKKGIALTMVTSDKSLKASLREEGVSVYDPIKDS